MIHSINSNKHSTQTTKWYEKPCWDWTLSEEQIIKAKTRLGQWIQNKQMLCIQVSPLESGFNICWPPICWSCNLLTYNCWPRQSLIEELKLCCSIYCLGSSTAGFTAVEGCSNSLCLFYVLKCNISS